MPTAQNPVENPLPASSVTMASHAEPRTRGRPGPRSGLFPCGECGKILSRRDALVRHVRLLHGGGENYWCHEAQCVQIKKGFRRFHDFKKHMLQVHNIAVSAIRPARVGRRNRDRPSATQSPLPQQHGLEVEPRDEVQPKVQPEVQSEVQSEAHYLPQSSTQHIPQQTAPYATPQAPVPRYVPDLQYIGSPAFKPTDWYYPVRATPAPAAATTPSQTPPFINAALARATATATAQQSLLLEAAMRNPGAFGGTQFAQLLGARMMAADHQQQQQSERFRGGAATFVLPMRPARQAGPRYSGYGDAASWGGQ
ncbi:hypothetical protein F4824DRAFT_509608 [Ustulina deusta]|nr:hypothetical protein F4824DRAFT_509608 [Ustulina deusta]